MVKPSFGKCYMSDFVKVYDTLLTSSVWFQGKDVRILWITLLVMADADGNVHSSLPGLAHTAALTRAETEAALSVLEAPDPDDTSGVLDGVRVVREPWGWHVVNRTAYR